MTDEPGPQQKVGRPATEAEKRIARAWVSRSGLTGDEAEREYGHVLRILVFANARPPRKLGADQGLDQGKH